MRTQGFISLNIFWRTQNLALGVRTLLVTIPRTVLKIRPQKLRESSVSMRDDLAETEWRERIYIEGSRVKVVGLIRGDQGDRQVNGKTWGRP